MSLHPLRQAAQFLLGVPTQGINPVLGRMLDLAQATPLCFVAVAGPDAGEAMSQLWRRGYQRVEAARKATCRAADEQSDVLLVLGCETLADARAVAASTMSMLRPGGTVVIDAGASEAQASALETILHGNAGGPFGALAALYGEWLGVERASVTFSEGEAPSASVPGHVNFTFEPLSGPDGGVTTIRNAMFGFAPEFLIGKAPGHSDLFGLEFDGVYGESADFTFASEMADNAPKGRA